MVLEQSPDVHLRAVFHSLGDAIVDVSPSREPSDVPASRLRPAGYDRPLEGSLVSIGYVRRFGWRRRRYGTVNNRRGDTAREQSFVETSHDGHPSFAAPRAEAHDKRFGSPVCLLIGRGALPW